MNTCKQTQRRDLAGKTRLTAITMGHGRGRVQRFVMLPHNEHGVAILPPSMLDKMLDDLRLHRGQTFTVG